MAEIDRKSWNRRLELGDMSVWGEQLVAMYAGAGRDEILQQVASREAFEASPLGKTSLPYESVCIDAHFYEALLQHISGPPADRRRLFREALERASRMGRTQYYETHMARYLLKSEK